LAADADLFAGAVERMIVQAIDAAHRAGKKIGICGQAPSDYPEFARFLVERGITSISLNPDTVIQTTSTILNAESEFAASLTLATALTSHTVVDDGERRAKFDRLDLTGGMAADVVGGD